MSHHTPLIATLVAGLCLAFLFGGIALRLRLSPIVGFLAAGVIAGPYTPGFIADQNLAPELAEIGVILLMFGVGLHFSVKDLLSVKGIAVPGAIAQILVATGMGAGLAWLLGWDAPTGLVFGLALSVASTVVLLKALEQGGLLDTRPGRIAVGWLVVEDLVTVVALVLLPVVASLVKAGGGVQPASLNEVSTMLCATLGKVAAFVGLMLVVGRRVIPWMLERVAGTGSREMFTLSILAVAIGIAFAASHLFGVSFALGAFVAGMVLAGSDLSHKAAEDTLPLRDAFAVLFFVSVGMMFDPAILVEKPFHVLGGVLIVVLGKSAAAYVIVRMFKRPRGKALLIAASLAQIGEFSFILMGLGLSLGLVTGDAKDVVLATAIISIALNPFLFVGLERYRKNDSAPKAMPCGQGGAPEESVEGTDEATDEVQGIDANDHVIVVGFGRIGGKVARGLFEAGVPLVVTDDAREKIATARENGYDAVLGNAVAEDTLKLAGIDRAKWIVVAVPNAFEAAQVVAHARALNPEIHIAVRARSSAESKFLLDHGADTVVNEATRVSDALVEDIAVKHGTPPIAPEDAPPPTMAA